MGQRTLSFVYLRHRLHNGLTLALGDTLALSVAILAAGLLRLYWLGEPVISAWSWIVLPAWWAGASAMRLLPSWGLGPVEELRRIVLLLAGVFAGVAVIVFLNQQALETSRLTFAVGLVLSLLLVPLTRLKIRRILTGLGQWGVPAVVYGAGPTGEAVIQMLQQEEGLGYRPVGVFDDDPTTWGRSVEGVRVLGGTDLVSAQAPIAILALPTAGRARQIELLEGPLSRYRTVLVIPDLMEAPSLWVRTRDLNGMIGLEITSNLTSPIARLFKRASDVLLVLLASPFWAPLCALLAGLIWLEDRQSPFFLQKRIGWDGQTFRAWKFRTMVPNAEEVLRRKLAEDEALRMEWETTYKLKKDPRITRIGSLLRRYSLDEFPQLINVLRGEMSLVGPRPLPQYHHEELTSRVRELRERVRPGITGLWQVSGRSDIGNAGMERWDPYYVRNWSIWLDIVVLIRTVRAVVKGSGAY